MQILPRLEERDFRITGQEGGLFREGGCFSEAVSFNLVAQTVAHKIKRVSHIS
jgi:hypothetical protein